MRSAATTRAVQPAAARSSSTLVQSGVVVRVSSDVARSRVCRQPRAATGACRGRRGTDYARGGGRRAAKEAGAYGGNLVVS